MDGLELSGKTTLNLAMMMAAQKAGGKRVLVGVEHVFSPAYAEPLGANVANPIPTFDKGYTANETLGIIGIEPANDGVYDFDVVAVAAKSGCVDRDWTFLGII